MRPFTIKTELVASDRASKAFNKANASARRLTKSVVKGSVIAGSTFSKFSKSVVLSTKKAVVNLNLLNARINQFSRNAKKKLGGIGRLGLGIGLLAIVTSVISANVELDKSFASLSAITGKTGKEFDAFKVQVSEVAKEQTLFAGETAKAFEIVASAKPVLLENAEALAKVTNAAITLSKASGDDLEQSSLSLTGVMNQFNLEASEAERTMNALAAGSVAGSANITNVSASLKNFGSVANSANLSMEQSVALVEVMGSKSIFAEEAGTKLTAAVLNLQAAGVGYSSGAFKMSDALDEVKKKVDAARTAKEKDAIITKIFKKTGITTGQILLNNAEMYENMTKSVTGTTTAVDQMNIKANTFDNRLQEIQASFKNSISATDEQGSQMQSLKDAMGFVAENMDKIIAGVIIALKVFAAYKAIMLVVNVVTWAFNSALLANPIVLIVLAIIALIAGIAALVIWWEEIVMWVRESDNVFAKLIRFALAPLIITFRIIGAIINWLVEKFNQLVNWVVTSDSGFAKFIRGSLMFLRDLFITIGNIIDWLGVKFNELVNWISNSDSGFAKFLRATLKPIIEGFRQLGELWDSLTGGDSALDKIKKMSESTLNIETNETIESKMSDGVVKNQTTNTIKEIAESKIAVDDVRKNQSTDKLISSLNNNSNELDKNTVSTKKQWTGKFTTSILKDANISENTTGSVQKELAIAAVDNEITNSKVQNDIINNSTAPTEVVTQNNSSRRNSSSQKGQIFINVVDRTGGKFGLDVESTGVDVVTTGNK